MPNAAAHGFALLSAAVLVDLAMIAGDMLLQAGVLTDPRHAIAMEGGYGESFQYVKAVVIAVLLMGIAPRSSGSVFWGAVFLVLLVDDAFALHESVGSWLAGAVDLPILRATLPEQVGEAILVSAGVLLLCGGAIWVHRIGGAPSRALSAALAPGLLLLIFFGGAVDLLHSMMRDHSIRYTLGLVEDGGEMVAMSLLTATVWAYSFGAWWRMPGAARWRLSRRISAR